MKLSVVIPARNEEGNIEQTLIGLRNHLDSANITDFELIVVDDGSQDATCFLVKAFVTSLKDSLNIIWIIKFAMRFMTNLKRG